MKFSDVETRIRRYLRDPNGSIWSQSLLIDLFNQAQDQFNKDTRILVKIGGVHVPGINDFTISYEWENEYTYGSTRRFGEYYDATTYLCTYKWEVAELRGYTPTDTDGYRTTHAWEIYSTSNAVEDWDILRFPNDYSESVLVAYNKKQLSRTNETQIMSLDSTYKTRSGEPYVYIPIYQDQEREFALYPRPSSVTFLDYGEVVPDIDCGYTYSFEADYIPSDSKSALKITANSNTYDVIYGWEIEAATGNMNPDSTYDCSGFYATNNYDVYHLEQYEGNIVSIGNTTTEEGIYYRWDDTVVEDTYGITVSNIPFDNNVLVIYLPRITKVVEARDDIENWLDWQVKYIERKVIELAFLCNNNRYNPGMASFWNKRYQDGLGVITRYKGKRMSAIRIGLKGTSRIPFGQINLVDLPDHYPSAHRRS